MSKPKTCMLLCPYLPKYPPTPNRHTYTDVCLNIFVCHWNWCVGIFQYWLDQCNCFFWLQLESVTIQTASTLLYNALLHERASCCKRNCTACGQNKRQMCFCVLFSRWALKVVVLSRWLLLQEPQKRAGRRERHFLQWALHFLFWDPIGGQLPSRNRDLWPCELACQHPDAGPSHAQRISSHDAAGRDAPQDWYVACENLRGPRSGGCKEKSQQGEDDSRARAG